MEDFVALSTLSRALDYGEERIRSNTVCPGTIRTPATLLHAAKLNLTVEQLTERSPFVCFESTDLRPAIDYNPTVI